MPETPQWEQLRTLEPWEQAAIEKKGNQQLQARYLHAHLTIRSMLRDLGNESGDAPCLVPGPHQRPQLAGANPQAPALDFSISYHGRCIALATATGARIGIDIEGHDRGRDYQRLYPGYASRPEREWLASRASAEQEEAFIAMWSLKEAWAKARGEGLGLDFSSVTLISTSADSVSADISAAGDRAENWYFDSFRLRYTDSNCPTARYRLGLAVHPNPGYLPLKARPAIDCDPGLELLAQRPGD